MLAPGPNCCAALCLPCADWQAWQWYSLAKMVHVVSHVGDPGSDASRVLVSAVSAADVTGAEALL